MTDMSAADIGAKLPFILRCIDGVHDAPAASDDDLVPQAISLRLAIGELGTQAGRIRSGLTADPDRLELAVANIVESVAAAWQVFRAQAVRRPESDALTSLLRSVDPLADQFDLRHLARLGGLIPDAEIATHLGRDLGAFSAEVGGLDRMILEVCAMVDRDRVCRPLEYRSILDSRRTTAPDIAPAAAPAP